MVGWQASRVSQPLWQAEFFALAVLLATDCNVDGDLYTTSKRRSHLSKHDPASRLF